MTGTFDNWTKSVQLDKQGAVFEKTVDLEDASKKIYYKVRANGPLLDAARSVSPVLPPRYCWIRSHRRGGPRRAHFA